MSDSAHAQTMITNPDDFASAASKTYAYAYNADGNYNVAYGEAFDYKAVEGWTDGTATASIRSMVKASGTHQGRSDRTDYNWITVYTNWNK